MAFCFQKVYGPEIEQLLRQYYQSLSEKDRRRFAAVEAITLGHGGISYIENILGCSRKTISTGMQELKQLPNDTTGNVDQATNMSHTSIHQKLPELEHRDIAHSSTLPLHQPLRRPTRVKEQHRIRQPGGGRKLTEEQNPTLVAALERMLSNDNEIAGDPMGKQKWVRSSTRRKGHPLLPGSGPEHHE